MAARNQDRLHLLGIRHHGPGSARAVVAALEACDPAIVLVEGPPDADDMIAFAGLPAMSPPLALLVHERDDPAKARFFPLAVFSPEWQAMRWALVRQRPVRFIDLPVSNRLAAQPTKDGPAAGCVPPSEEEEEEEKEKEKEKEENTEDAAKGDPGADASSAAAPDDELGSIRHDPLAYLAELAGYDDSEAWWNALIEQGAHGPDIFAALEAAMAALREAIDPLPWRTPEEALNERRREAHMRLAIGKALAETEAPVAVVCGAWHVPALRRAVPARDDRALVKGLASVKVTATWIPWTETRLSVHTGYGAGVVSPGWYTHLWQELQPGRSGTESAPRAAAAFATRWQARVAGLLRRNGRPVSTATVIEAVRLSLSLASLRDLALPGLAEMRDASLATLCEGERAAFRLIEQRLVVGDAVGAIDESVPQMPLAADLARSQRRLKLKPEALDADISLDLRSDAGLAKSQLLHRLALLDVPWGSALSAGHSRGSFRENWRLRWEPEFSVRLAEALVYGTTVEQAAGNAAVARAEQATSLEAISAIVRGCLDAGLDQAAGRAVARLQRQSAATNDIASLAGAVPPLADVLRYGTARAMPLDALRLLVTSLTEAVCAGLVYACRGLQPEPARELRTGLGRLNVAMTLIDDAALTATWHRSVALVAGDGPAHPLLRGQATRILYDRGMLGPDAASLHLSRALSPSVPAGEAGDWLGGFLGNSGQVLLHDVTLRRIIHGWLVAITEEEFTNLLPVMRRAFSSFDRSERRRLLDEVAKMPAKVAGAPGQPAPALASAPPGYAAALPLLLTILGADESTLKDTSP